jgi:hypothetical protein
MKQRIEDARGDCFNSNRKRVRAKYVKVTMVLLSFNDVSLFHKLAV